MDIIERNKNNRDPQTAAVANHGYISDSKFVFFFRLPSDNLLLQEPSGFLSLFRSGFLNPTRKEKAASIRKESQTASKSQLDSMLSFYDHR